MGRREEPAWKRGIVGLSMARERGDIQKQFQHRLTVTRDTIERLGHEATLHGHMGCVNCLEWNKDGSVLASASDDLHIILWDPYRHKKIHKITTGHTGNIFSVKFLTPDILATCAADGMVRARSVSTGTSLLECSCHCGRVKRLATSPENPSISWSAGEDGLILQHDMRLPHRCNADSSNVLVNLLNHMGRYAEAKCVAVNPRRAYQLAVGANDFYVRLYDTRMIKLARLQVSENCQGGGSSSRMMWERQNVRCARAGAGDPDNNVPRAAVHYFAPGHLTMETGEQPFPKKATTYVAFSHDGNELLVNLGSEQVYLYDINSARRPMLVESFIIQHNHGVRDRPRNGHARAATPHATPQAGPASDPPMPDRVKHLKELFLAFQANDHVKNADYEAAIQLYNRAIADCPRCAVLYSNRAAALMRRGWSGDIYAAIQDCYRAIKLDPGHVKSHFRLAKGLMDMKRAREAHECLLYFKDKFPRHSGSHAVFLLQKDINVALEGMEQPHPDEVPEANTKNSGETDESHNTSVLERQLRASALDYSQRFLGHCNTTTDIKEASFLGPNAEYIAAGSDDGCLFIWCRRSGNIVRVLRGDESIVNCVQLHPACFLLATSGIEAAVRLWSPQPEDGNEESRVVEDTLGAAYANQRRMRSDPFEAMLLNISFAGNPDRELQAQACRPS
ncbi:WD and tetratricopeptide repeats protein 1 isoform X1 [Ostrinia furnacalis]|uniref:WD and tetratricopeptide repeats protein 1 isoform X1 n=1 Tax=Ostrinia furnacalis TaxID=93504 RepID=UPI00103DF71E|nr:WD and tetratricopeptide repeats protein 1 isoform X1 [Ostrinia furnacalis]